MVNIAFTGGGTGGHIYPGLAVAAELKSLLANAEFRLFWIGSSTGMDRGIVEEAGIEFFGIPSGKLRRYFSFRTAVDFFRVIAGFFAAKKILKKQRASLIFSKGGFVSVPPCAAAASLRIPVFTHESDFSPGLATRINVRYVQRTPGFVFTTYEDTARFFNEKIRSRVVVSGNPVRAVFRNADAAKGRAFLGVRDDARILLVLGGSLGALEINELVHVSLAELTEVYTVVHQTGPNLSWDLGESEKYKTFPFIREEMPHVMAAAEIVLGRSGAGIWEWAVCGKPMLLIPLRGSGTRGDQVENARFFEKAGAALVLTGEDANPRELIRAVKTLAHDGEKRKVMAACSAKIGERDGAEIIARTLAEKINKLTEGKK
jgi:UDP-N-acetylglucosamine--N-acetylmuramyl-(pentapeptide) pyrophosphoryl-undecaprenol N-acetylglucosamine transferase